MDVLPIDIDLIKKHSVIPELLAQATYLDSEYAITQMRRWGEHAVPISVLYGELKQFITERQGIA